MAKRVGLKSMRPIARASGGGMRSTPRATGGGKNKTPRAGMKSMSPGGVMAPGALCAADKMMKGR